MSESYSTIVSGEKNPIEKHDTALIIVLREAKPQFRELFSTDYSHLDKQEKNKIANKMNKLIREHQASHPELLLINPYTLQLEWTQYEDNRRDLERLLSGPHDEIFDSIQDLCKIVSELSEAKKRSVARKYNKTVAVLRNKGFPYLLTINSKTLYYELNEIKSVLDSEAREPTKCALTGCEREEDTIGFKLSRRKSGFFSSTEEAFYAIRASIESSSCKLLRRRRLYLNDFPTEFGSMSYYILLLPFTKINKDGSSSIVWIRSTEKQIVRALTPYGDIPLYFDNNPGEGYEYYLQIKKLLLSKIKKLINENADDEAEHYVFHCNNVACEHFEGGFIASKENKCVRCPNFLNCHREFCVECKDTFHGDFACNMSPDEMTAQLLSQTTKPCPSCQRPIEKNGGCNHMTCINCGQHSCWICGATFDQYTQYHDLRDPCPGNVWLAEVQGNEDNPVFDWQ